VHEKGHIVGLDPVPDAEQEAAAGLQHSKHLAIRPRLVGKEHDPELAHDCVEGLLREWQVLGIRLLPLDPFATRLQFGEIEHRFVEVGGGNRHRSRQCSGERARKDPGAASRLEQPPGAHVPQTARDIRSVGLEKNIGPI
jgi:hypothetical protein